MAGLKIFLEACIELFFDVSADMLQVVKFWGQIEEAQRLIIAFPGASMRFHMPHFKQIDRSKALGPWQKSTVFCVKHPDAIIYAPSSIQSVPAT